MDVANRIDKVNFVKGKRLCERMSSVKLGFVKVLFWTSVRRARWRLELLALGGRVIVAVEVRQIRTMF